MALMLPRTASPQGLMASGSETHGALLPTLINLKTCVPSRTGGSMRLAVLHIHGILAPDAVDKATTKIRIPQIICGVIFFFLLLLRYYSSFYVYNS